MTVSDSERNREVDSRKADREKLLQCLRELAAELIDLTELIAKARAGQTGVARHVEYIRKTRKDLAALTAEIGDLNTARSDTVRHILNLWEQMANSAILISPEQELSVQDQMHELTMLEDLTNRMILKIGMRTVPPRVNDWLKKARPGHYLPFHLLFEDEVPSREAREKVLNAISWAPDTVDGGLVNPGSGLIYSYEREWGRRAWSFVTILLVLAACSAIVYFSAYISRWHSGWPIPVADAPKILFFWVALLLGIVTHIGIANVKKIKNAGLPPVIAAGDWLKHVSARKGEILLKIFMSLVAFYILVFSLNYQDLKIYSAFLVGYSLDSFIEIFGTSLEQKATGQLEVLKGQLGIREK